MFAQIVTALTLLATLTHSVLGCCWHHDHAGHCHGAACEHSNGQQVTSGESALPGGECFGHDDDALPPPQEPLSQDPCEDSSEGCNEPHCVYTAAKEVQLPTLNGWIAFLTSPLVLQVSAAVVVAPQVIVDIGPPPRPAVQLRALLQVWVI